MNSIRRHPVAAFLVLAYVSAGSWWIPLAVAGAVVRPGVGWPTHMIGLCGPALAAVAVTAIVDGRAGLRDLAGRMTKWRIGWSGVVMLAVPVGLLGLGWAGWHAPLFFLVAKFQGFSAGTLAGFVLGIAAGALVLSSVYDRTGSSIFAVACWHAAYNLSSASTATQGVIAALSTTAVMVWAAWLLLAAYRRRTPKALRPSMK